MKTRVLIEDLENRGIVGDVTDMTYSNGAPMQVGGCCYSKFSKSFYTRRRHCIGI